MSSTQVDQVKRHCLKPAHQLILLHVADQADDEGFVRPSISYLEWLTGYKKRNIQKIIKELKDEGLLAPVETSPEDPFIVWEWQLNWEAATLKEPFDGAHTHARINGNGKKPAHGNAPGGEKSPLESEALRTAVRTPLIKEGEDSLIKESKDQEPAHSDAPAEDKPKKLTAHQDMVRALSEVTGFDVDMNIGRLGKMSTKLRGAGYTPAFVEGDFKRWWYAHDWRGKKNQQPTPEQIGNVIGRVPKEQASPEDIDDLRAKVKKAKESQSG